MTQRDHGAGHKPGGHRSNPKQDKTGHGAKTQQQGQGTGGSAQQGDNRHRDDRSGPASD